LTGRFPRRSSSDNRRGAWFACVASVSQLGLFALALALLATCIGLTTSTATAGINASTPRVELRRLADAPRMAMSGDLMEQLAELLERLKEVLDVSYDAVDESPAPLDARRRAIIRSSLNDAEQIILEIQDPDIEPTLSPADAGSIDDSVNPGTLYGYAEACRQLAGDAYLHVLLGPEDLDHEYVGTRLKTIQDLIPGYRTLAGLDD
jgi:hypothetical protein